ncbi:MAG: 5'-methylthioadenosine/adenosylhomocysteine nucleosidase [Spirochaetales bacterium]|nr:5'-methylthioadenosine/adenosylhomocysteine nucleosidase [Spirochaetales bacterium]
MDTIGIIGAMEEEIELLKERFACNEVFEWGGSVFHIGRQGRYRIVLMKSGIGKVNAAIGASLLISRYDPICLINTGSAGAVDRELNVGDVVISSEVVHHDVDVTSFGYAMGQVPEMPEAFLPHDVLVTMAVNGAKKLGHLSIFKGMVATGDSFISGEAALDKIRQNFPDAYATEMEAAAIAQTCHQFKKPFLIIRSVSDKADGNAAISFEEFLKTAARNSAQLVEGIVTELEEYVEQKESDRLEEIFPSA